MGAAPHAMDTVAMTLPTEERLMTRGEIEQAINDMMDTWKIMKMIGEYVEEQRERAYDDGYGDAEYLHSIHCPD